MNWSFLLACLLTVALYEHVERCSVKPMSAKGLWFLFFALAMFVCGATIQ
jgi:hypothetical protein